MDATPATDTRTRMLDAAVTGLQRRGVAGMSFTEVLADSGAARGAIYHHFPGGKHQLVAEAARRNGDDVRAHLSALPAADPGQVVKAFLTAIRPVLGASAGGGGCAVAAVSVGESEPAAAGRPADTPEPLRRVADIAFASWIDALAERLVTAGLRPQESRDLAATLVMLLEGAHVLCRAAGTLDPFESAARTIIRLVRERSA